MFLIRKPNRMNQGGIGTHSVSAPDKMPLTVGIQIANHDILLK